MKAFTRKSIALVDLLVEELIVECFEHNLCLERRLELYFTGNLVLGNLLNHFELLLTQYFLTDFANSINPVFDYRLLRCLKLSLDQFSHGMVLLDPLLDILG